MATVHPTRIIMVELDSSKLFSSNCRSRNLYFEKIYIRVIDFRGNDFEQLISSNCIRGTCRIPHFDAVPLIKKKQT